jgi:hypothetical protein
MLYEKLKEDLKTAMKERREFDLGVLRMVITALNNRMIEKRGKEGVDTLSEEEVSGVLQKEAKKRKEAAVLYAQGGRPELEATEIREAEFIGNYLPKQMSEDEVETIVKKVLASDEKDFGKIMGAVMKEVKGRADGNMVGTIIKRLQG